MGENCVGGDCTMKLAECNHGCTAGFFTETCELRCPEYTKSTCSIIDGRPDECVVPYHPYYEEDTGAYGGKDTFEDTGEWVCKRCPENCLGGECQQDEEGACTKGCVTGFTGPYCDEF